MASKDENNVGAIPQPTSSAKNPRRCSTCGNLKNRNEHDDELCNQMKRFKEAYLQEKASARIPTIVKASTEACTGTSISEVAHRPMPSGSGPFLPQVAEDPIPSSDHSSKAMIYLPVTSQPNLSTRYAPMLEMRTLLLLRSLNFSNFHVNERGDWAFIASGSREKMASWVVENRRMTASRLSGRSAFQTVVGLVLGFMLGVISILWVLWIGRMFRVLFRRWIPADTH
jgi:hypothetical protein